MLYISPCRACWQLRLSAKKRVNLLRIFTQNTIPVWGSHSFPINALTLFIETCKSQDYLQNSDRGRKRLCVWFFRNLSPVAGKGRKFHSGKTQKPSLCGHWAMNSNYWVHPFPTFSTTTRSNQTMSLHSLAWLKCSTASNSWSLRILASLKYLIRIIQWKHSVYFYYYNMPLPTSALHTTGNRLTSVFDYLKAEW